MSRAVALCLMMSFGCAGMKAQQQTQQNKAAVAQESTPGQPKPKGRMTCRMERDTGSNFMDKVCTYVDAPNPESSPDDAQEVIRRMQQQGDTITVHKGG